MNGHVDYLPGVCSPYKNFYNYCTCIYIYFVSFDIIVNCPIIKLLGKNIICAQASDFFHFRARYGYVKYRKLKMLKSRLKIKISKYHRRFSADNVLI